MKTRTNNNSRNNGPTKGLFAPQKSGNRKGRPKGALGAKAIVQKFAHEMHTLPLGDGEVRLNTVQLIARVLCDRAAGGDVAASRLFDTLQSRYATPAESGGYLVVPEPYPNEGDWERAAQVSLRWIEKMNREHPILLDNHEPDDAVLARSIKKPIE
jgi:hypothetical protein